MPVQISNKQSNSSAKPGVRAGSRISPVVAIVLAAVAVVLIGYVGWRSLAANSAQMDASTVQQHMDAKRAKVGHGGMPLGIGAQGTGTSGSPAAAGGGERPGRMMK